MFILDISVDNILVQATLPTPPRDTQEHDTSCESQAMAAANPISVNNNPPTTHIGAQAITGCGRGKG